MVDLSRTHRECSSRGCRRTDLQGVWWSSKKGAQVKDLGLPFDPSDYLFRCRQCGFLSTPSSALADSSRWIAYTRPARGSQTTKGRSDYGSVPVEVWEERGYWYADPLGFPSLLVKGLTKEQVFREAQKRVEKRVSANYEKLTGTPWVFEEIDPDQEIYFYRGVDPNPMSGPTLFQPDDD